MPLPFEEFQGKGVLDFSSSSSSSCSEPPILHLRKITAGEEAAANLCYAGEPTSVLDAVRSPSPLTTSSSTVSSSHGGNSGGAAVSGNAATTADNTEEKCGGHMGVEDWDNVLSGGSPSHEQSILRLIIGDVEDPSVGLNKILQATSSATGFQQSPPDSELNAVGSGFLDPGFGFEPVPDSICSSGFSIDPPILSVPPPAPPLFPPQQTSLEVLEEKPQIFNPQVVINQNQAHFTQNTAMLMPVPYGQFQEHHNFPGTPPPAKRLNPGPIGFGPGFNPAQRIPISPFSDPTRPGFIKPATTTTMAAQQIQQGITDQLFKVAELIESGGDPSAALAQGILARLNQQLSSPIGKPFQRAAFYFKEALQKLLLNATAMNDAPQAFSSYSLIFKIGAYKSFSEISPILQFANFTSNQALLESFRGFDRVHLIDFDIGYGGQWASLMQELVLRNGGAPSLKLTVFASPATHDELELGFTQENLKHFASEINISLEIEVLNLEMLNSISWHSPEKEAVAVNLSVAVNTPSYLPLILRFVKQISPTILVCSDRGCERTDLPFPQQLIHSLQSHAALLESLDSVNASLDAMQKIERFLIQPSIEQTVANRGRQIDRTVHWRSMFLQMGLSPVIYSNFTESQAECLVQRTPVRGFHVEKRQNSLVLCWQGRELVGVSAWKCCG